MHKVNLANAFTTFSDFWNPKIAGEINSCVVKLVKIKGAFEWHHHQHEDEFFLVVDGRLRMGLRDGDIDLDPGEYIVIPRRIEHRPEALTEVCHLLLFEPKSTLNTGNLLNDRTLRDLDLLPKSSA